MFVQGRFFRFKPLGDGIGPDGEIKEESAESFRRKIRRVNRRMCRGVTFDIEKLLDPGELFVVSVV